MAKEATAPGGRRELKGIFISFEGCEGCGKTTQAEMLREYLLSKGKDVVLTREPGDTKVGRMIRELLLDPDSGLIEPICEALLFAADRVQHVREIIMPALEKGWIVIADRFTDSSLAYQGVGRGVGLEAVKNLNDWAVGEIEPNITFYLDLPAEEALKRKSTSDRIESESIEFHENVRNAYDILARIYSYRFVKLDAMKHPSEIHTSVIREVEKFIEEKWQVGD